MLSSNHIVLVLVSLLFAAQVFQILGVFGSILERAPPEGLAKVSALLESYKERVEYQCKKGRPCIPSR